VGYYFEKQRWKDKEEKHAEVIWRKALAGDGLYPRKVKYIVEDQHLRSKWNSLWFLIQLQAL
jgi:hypothetical protein